MSSRGSVWVLGPVLKTADSGKAFQKDRLRGGFEASFGQVRTWCW